MKNLFATSLKLTVGQKMLRLNWSIVIVVSVLASAGVVALYSVAGGAFTPWADRHALRFVIAAGLMLGMALVTPRVWMAAAYPAYAIAVAALVAVAFVGVETLGARRWLDLGGMSLQPSELVKVALVLSLARYYHHVSASDISKPAALIVPALLIALPVILVLRQPDLGTAVLFAAIGVVMVFAAGVSLWYFAAGIGGGIAVLPMVWANLHGYQRARIETFLDPSKDALGAGYHITQSKIAFGAGGVSGRGFMQGTQSQLDFLPEKHTDFIFTMVGEEWGFVGTLALLCVFGALVIRLMMMAFNVRHTFGRLVIVGVATTIFVYVFINIAMVTGLVPVVGVPLPLISYGGSAMFTVCTLIGLALSAAVHGKQDPTETRAMIPL